MTPPRAARSRRRTALVAATVAVAVAAAAIVVGTVAQRGGGGDPTTPAPATGTPGTDPATGSPGHGGKPGGVGGPGMGNVLPAGFSVRAGTAAAGPPVGSPVVTGTPLPPGTLAAILRRLPAWDGTAGSGADYRWPTTSLTRPAAGTTVTQSFPAPPDSQIPPTAPTVPPTGPVRVLRVQPEGSVSVAPFVSITFDQPMVAVGTVGQVDGTTAGVSITPKVPGRWEWIGTQTLRFADGSGTDRLPMATRYSVTVPAGIRSAGGGTLATAFTATFDTPPPVVTSFTPGSEAPVALHPVMVAVFNQRVDPATVLGSIAVTADGRGWPVRLATPAEIDSDPNAAAALSAAPAGRTVALVPTRDFPAGSPIEVTLKPGTRSAEGPLTSATAARFRFSTYPPMTLGGASCADSGCEPGGPLQLTFSNPIDVTAFDPASVTVDPAIPGGASITADGNRIVVSGATKAASDYRVTIAAGLADAFGQRMAAKAGATVSVGHANPRIYPFPTAVTTLDPMSARPTVTVPTVNQKRFRERVFAVAWADWPAYQAWLAQLLQLTTYRAGDDLRLPTWPALVDRTVAVSGAGDQVTATVLDLSGPLATAAARPDQRAQVVVVVEPVDPAPPDMSWLNHPTATWVQSGTLAVDAITDQTTLHAWVTDLRTGTPVSGATVTLRSSGGASVGSGVLTDSHGLATIGLTAAAGSLLTVTAGDQRTLLPADMWGNTWRSEPQPARLLWYVTDDRQTYRPGETVSVKGWVRRQAADSTMALSVPGSGTVSWSAVDGSGTAMGSGTATVDRFGGFDLTVTVPAGANLGTADLHLALPGADQDPGHDHLFTIADYRTPAFEVQAHAPTADPAVRGVDLPLQVDARYYAGGPVGDATVDWQVQTAAASYAPPGWSGYTFGIWTPWWFDTGAGIAGFVGSNPPCCGYPTPGGDATVRRFHGTTDGSGSDALAVTVGDLGPDTAGLPVTVQAQATVTDVDRQQIAGTATVLVHPAAYYVGLASDSTFIKQGEKLTVTAVATDIEGAAAAGRPITVTAARVIGGAGALPAGSSTETLADPQTCQVASSATPVSCTFTPTVGGEYRITALVTDERGRTSRTQLTRWVAGPDGSIDTTVAEQSLTLIPDRREYAPGRSAQLLVASPIATGTGLITLDHQGIVSTTTFAVTDSSAVVSIPIAAGLVPGVSVSVEVVGTAPRSGDPAGGSGVRPAYATGQIDLTVSTASRGLTVVAKPRLSTVAPGGRTTIDVTVTDPAGKPVPDSQFEVMVVDEAVLALSGYQLPDPLEAFYPRTGSGWLWSVYGRSTVMLGTPEPDGTGEHGSAAASSAAASAAPAVPSAGSGPGFAAGSGAADSAAGSASTSGRSAGGAASTTPITQRSSFAALALFAPTVTTGSDGTASIPVTLPDNLTRYRVMVVAVASGERFGTGESTITAGLPLTVRPSPPRFLNFGDRADLPVVVQNLTDAPLTTDVVLQAANLTVSGAGSGPTAGATGQTVSIPANGRVEVRFPVAADKAGTARLRVVAVGRGDAVAGGDASDAAVEEFPVYTPSTSETFATYGTLAGGAVIAQQLTAPTGVIPAFGGLTVSTSSTALAQLTDALDGVVTADYLSSDALACRIIAISSLGDVLQAFSAPGLPSADALKALVVGDIGRLVGMQNGDGGFAYWESGDDSDPFNTVQAVQALVVAARSGYAGSEASRASAAVTKALPYLRGIDGRLPAGISQQSRDTIDAYAISVRALAGDASATGDADLLATSRGAALPMDGVGWLLPVVSAGPRQSLLTRVSNAAVDDAGSVTFTQGVTDDSWTVLASQPRTDALILDGLLAVDKGSDLIGKVVAGLMALQHGGRWDTVQDNTFVLVAMRHYYDAFESTTPHFTAGVWLGDRLAAVHDYAGHTTEQTSVTIPTGEVIKQGDTAVTVSDQGSGRMYYRIALTTAPSSLSVPALDRGFVVARSYAGADRASDVTQDGKGVWHVKAGARVRVTLTLVSRSAQSHVALTDPLPAGLEPLNPQLATTPKDLPGRGADTTAPGTAAAGTAGAGTAAGSAPSDWMPVWFDHQNLRDDRAEAFAGWLPGGVYTYSYLALASTPGTFVVPPATGQQIYAPETFGRTATDHVVVG
jgi:uncharacterized protein YfaS (alpha-2-macroglobulin family)